MRILHFIAVAAVALLLPHQASAQLTGRSRSVAERIETMFTPYARTDAPGCAVGVIREGGLEYARGFGMADLSSDVPLSPSTPVYVASTSKQFTAYSILLLAHDGKLSLDDHVRKFVPEVPEFGTPITIRHLLHHTSGLRDYFGLFALRGWRAEGSISEAEFLAILHAQRALNFRPGARYLYSKTGYVVLSLVVRRVSGQSLRDFAAARIFGPLGMASSQFRDDHRMAVANRALGYEPTPNGYRTSRGARHHRSRPHRRGARDGSMALVGRNAVGPAVWEYVHGCRGTDRPVRSRWEWLDGVEREDAASAVPADSG